MQNNNEEEYDPFAPPPPPPSSVNQRVEPERNFSSDEPTEVLVEYSFRDFERFTTVSPNDMIAYQAGRKSFYDILYDKKTPCGPIYNDMMHYVHNLAVETGKDISVDEIKDSVIRKTFLECIDFHSHLYEYRTKNLVMNIEGNSK